MECAAQASDGRARRACAYEYGTNFAGLNASFTNTYGIHKGKACFKNGKLSCTWSPLNDPKQPRARQPQIAPRSLQQPLRRLHRRLACGRLRRLPHRLPHHRKSPLAACSRRLAPEYRTVSRQSATVAVNSKHRKRESWTKVGSVPFQQNLVWPTTLKCLPQPQPAACHLYEATAPVLSLESKEVGHLREHQCIHPRHPQRLVCLASSTKWPRLPRPSIRNKLYRVVLPIA